MSGRAQTAFIILAHSDAPMVRRLISALRGADVFLHCDAGTPGEVAAAMVPDDADHVRVIPRRKMKLASWSLVEAELAGLRMALEYSSAEHIAIVSGSSYPLVPLEAIDAAFGQYRAQMVVELHPIPYSNWNARWNADGGMWRFRRRFLTTGDNVVTLLGNGVPLWRRPIPSTLELYGGAQWKTYSRVHARALLDVLDTQTEQRRYWRHVFLPEESCAASILKSPQLVGDLAAQVVNRDVWFIDWPHTPARQAPHPSWLTSAHFDALAEVAQSREKLFARKVKSTEAELLDRVDAELLS